MSIIVMSDQDFEENMQFLASQFNPVLADSFRARDKAQCDALVRVQAELDEYISSVPGIEYERDNLRAALARVEAEAGRLAEAGLAAHVKATAAQTQLADVLYILDQHRAWTGMGWEQLPVPVHAVEKIRSKLAPAEQQEAPMPEYFQEACDKFDWTPEEALRFYAEGKHFDTDRGRTRILDTGAIASNALKHASLAYLEMKGDAELSELRAAVGAKQKAQGAQAGEFQREDRYLVIKRKDLALLSPTDRDLALTLMGELSAIMATWNVPERQYLVIESDWPEYEPTWAAIESRMTGQGAQAGDERAAFEAWFTEKAKTLPLLRGESVLRYHKGEGQYVSDWALFGHMVWQARAALATQPAKWVDPVCPTTSGPVYEQGFADGVAQAWRLNYVPTVRGAEHGQ